MEPMATVDLDAIIRKTYHIGTITRAAAQAVTPITNGEARDITGIDEVMIRVADTKNIVFQCAFCGDHFPTAASARSHLVVHSADKQTMRRDAEQVAAAVLQGKPIYAPYDTDEENILFMKRTFEVNAAALSRVLRAARAGGKRVVGQTTIPTDELRLLRDKAKAYDALKAQTLKSQFPV